MRLDRFEKYNRLVIGGHAMILSNDDLDSLRSLLGENTRQLSLKRMPKSEEMKRMRPGEVVFIACEGLNATLGHAKAWRMSKDGRRYVYRKLDDRHAIIARLT
jgi:hypothetical protein